MKAKLHLIAEFEVEDRLDPVAECRRQLDAFREAVRPSSEYGITITECCTPRVLIEVSGGCVNTIYADVPILYRVKDWDNIMGGDAEDYLASATDFSPADIVLTPNQLDEESKDGVEEHVGKNV